MIEVAMAQSDTYTVRVCVELRTSANKSKFRTTVASTRDWVGNVIVLG
jgi:hypothetical protein